MSPISFSKALVGYELYTRAKQLSPNTIADYKNTFRKFTAYLGSDLDVTAIDHNHIIGFLGSLPETLSPKTARNYHTGLSSLWTWMKSEQIVPVQILIQVPRPKPTQTDIIPFSEANIRALLRSTSRSKTYSRLGKQPCSNALDPQTAQRNRLIILVLLDTGLRASELCNIKLHNIEMERSLIKTLGKGDKERHIPFSDNTAQALWRYITFRDKVNVGTHLFVTDEDRPFTRDRLKNLLNALGDRANVPNCHAHRFRHTFAIQFLRNGGDVFTLKELLGHSSLDMVKRYLAIAQVDVEAAHKKASPVSNWHL